MELHIYSYLMFWKNISAFDELYSTMPSSYSGTLHSARLWCDVLSVFPKARLYCSLLMYSMKQGYCLLYWLYFQVSGHEAAATTILTLTSGGTSPAATTLAFSGTTFSELKLTEGITVLQLIEKFKEVCRHPGTVYATCWQGWYIDLVLLKLLKLLCQENWGNLTEIEI